MTTTRASRAVRLRMARLLLAAATISAVGAGGRGVAGADDESGEEPTELLDPFIDPAAESLLELVPITEAEKLTESAVRSANLCAVLELRDDVREPKGDDPAALVDYSNKYHGVLRLFLPTGKIDHPTREGVEIQPPSELVDAIAKERAAMYAYHVRVQAIQGSYKEKAFDAAERDRRLRRAFTLLVASDYTAAEADLVAGQQRYCDRT